MDNIKNKITITVQEKNTLKELKCIFSNLPEQIFSDKQYLKKEDITTNSKKEQYTAIFLEMAEKADILFRKFSTNLTASFTKEEIAYHLDDLFLFLYIIQYNKKYIDSEKKISQSLIDLFDKFFVFESFNKKLSMKFLRLTKANLKNIKRIVNIVPFIFALLITSILLLIKLIQGTWDIINYLDFLGLLLLLHGTALCILKATILFFAQFHRSRQEYYYIFGGFFIIFISQLVRISL